MYLHVLITCDPCLMIFTMYLVINEYHYTDYNDKVKPSDKKISGKAWGRVWVSRGCHGDVMSTVAFCSL